MAIFFSFMLIFPPCDVVPGSLKYAAGAMSIIANSGERHLPFYQGHTAGGGGAVLSGCIGQMTNEVLRQIGWRAGKARVMPNEQSVVGY